MRLRLYPKQGIAFQSEATEVLYGGAAGGGKSHLMRVAAIAWGLAVSGLQIYLFRRVYNDLQKNHMEGPTSFPSLLAPWVDAKHVSINYSQGQIALPGGSKIHLCHCQHEKDVYKYQGAEIHALMIDELTQWTPTAYAFLRSRVRMAGLDIDDKYRAMFPRILCGANPGGVGHNWVKSAFIDPAGPLEVWQAPKEEGGLNRQYIPARLDDNPALKKSDPNYKARLQGLGSKHLIKAMLDGDWNIVAGGALDDVWRPDVHVIPPFDIPRSWRVDRSFDWGSSHPFSVGWWAESNGETVTVRDGTTREFPKGTLFRIAELYGWNGKPDEGCRMLAVDVARKILEIEKGMGRSVVPGPADPAIYASQNGNCIADDMARAGVRWEKADNSPGSRKQGLEKLRQLFTASAEFPQEDPGIFVFDTCRQFIRTIPVLPRAENDPDDVNTKAEDHIYDETRYRITAKKHEFGVFSPMG